MLSKLRDNFQGLGQTDNFILPDQWMLFSYMRTYIHRECVSTGAAGAQARRSWGHHLLHMQILRRLVLLKPTDFEAQSSLL